MQNRQTQRKSPKEGERECEAERKGRGRSHFKYVEAADLTNHVLCLVWSLDDTLTLWSMSKWERGKREGGVKGKRDRARIETGAHMRSTRIATWSSIWQAVAPFCTELYMKGRVVVKWCCGPHVVSRLDLHTHLNQHKWYRLEWTRRKMALLVGTTRVAQCAQGPRGNSLWKYVLCSICRGFDEKISLHWHSEHSFL